MIGLHIDKIGIGKPSGKTPPIPKIRGHHDFFGAALPVEADRKSKSGTDPVVRQSEGINGEVTDREGLFGKRTDLEMQKRKLAKVPARQRLNILFIKINRNPAFFQEAERGILDVVTVQMGNDYPVNFEEVPVQGPSAGPHGGKSGINQQGGLIRSQEQGVSRTAAAEGLKS
jgi:hypothetical protein